jgi:acyl-CoA hydrolase
MIAARDLNSNGTLFGGRVLDWIDEEAFIYASCQLETESVVTRTMSEINFVSTARQGEVVEIGMDAIAFGRTSITLKCEVRNRRTRRTITAVDRIVFVRVDDRGLPTPHGKTHVDGSETGSLEPPSGLPTVETGPAGATSLSMSGKPGQFQIAAASVLGFLQPLVRVLTHGHRFHRNY